MGRKDLLAILRVLSAGRYTAEELERIVPYEVIMASGVFAMAERRAKVDAVRQLCLDMVEKHHPELVAQVAPRVEACSSLTGLKSWTLLASESEGRGLLDALAMSRSPAESRAAARRSTGRSPRPARRTKPRR